jgi:hypothetical protein
VIVAIWLANGSDERAMCPRDHGGDPGDGRETQTFVLPARRRSSHGLDAWDQPTGYEGFVSKDPMSSYVGGRTLKWLKVKQRDYRVEERGWDNRK